MLFLLSIVVATTFLLGPPAWGELTASTIRGTILVPFLWLQGQAEEGPEPLVLRRERRQELGSVGRRIALGQQRLEPRPAAASRCRLLLEPDQRGEHRVPETVRDGEGNPCGGEEGGHREQHAAGEERGVTPAETSVRRGEHP